jgi:hypothetical protein
LLYFPMRNLVRYLPNSTVGAEFYQIQTGR